MRKNCAHNRVRIESWFTTKHEQNQNRKKKIYLREKRKISRLRCYTILQLNIYQRTYIYPLCNSQLYPNPNDFTFYFVVLLFAFLWLLLCKKVCKQKKKTEWKIATIPTEAKRKKNARKVDLSGYKLRWWHVFEFYFCVEWTENDAYAGMSGLAIKTCKINVASKSGPKKSCCFFISILRD